MSQEIPPFLGDNERVLTSLRAEDWGLFVTTWRLIFLKKTRENKIRTIHDYDYKNISYIKCESKAGEDLRLLGAALIIVGLASFVFGYYYPEGASSLMIIGGLLFIGGIAALSTKADPVTTLSIQMSGVDDTKTISMGVTAAQIDDMLKFLAEMREKTTLRHDSIMKFSEQE